ncbi:hypothetical protein Y032_0007g3269 [Ancylostoma ceylanicum]|uniref:Uncharacterized protein n=1 Tax=Ancylostoma ceylanicum TaxID=53326 RepID=A0A016VP47_9BILA|nr:hypothetical protein Y032_0007g3269 [Ancylostoma ceylanicum]
MGASAFWNSALEVRRYLCFPRVDDDELHITQTFAGLERRVICASISEMGGLRVPFYLHLNCHPLAVWLPFSLSTINRIASE